MKHFLLFIVFAFSMQLTTAQSSLYTDGTVINTNFTITDIDTVTLNIDSLVSTGKNILVFFFSANDMSNCRLYNNSHILENYYNVYGPAGSQQYNTEIFMVDEDPNTSRSDIINGGWTTGNTFHICNDVSMSLLPHFVDMSSQPVNLPLPSVILVCSNNRQMFSIPTNITNTTALNQQILSDCFPLKVNKDQQINLAYKLIPNPTDDLTILRLDLPGSSIVNCTISNATGQIIHKLTMQLNSGINNLSIPTNEWNNGLYFVHLQSGEQTADARLIVQH